jgi:hypothetical protein
MQPRHVLSSLSGAAFRAAGAWKQTIGSRWQYCHRPALLRICFEGGAKGPRKV